MNWDAINLSRRSPVPLYYQLVEHIREAVRAGRLAPGDRLPAERVIAEQAGVSRMTARQALSLLDREGVIAVRPGIGTFVVFQKRTYDVLHLAGFTEETTRHGEAVLTEVIEQTVGAPPQSVANGLRLERGQEALKLVRLHAADRTPVLLATSYLAAARFAGLEEEDLTAQSLYTLLANGYDTPILRAAQTIEASTASAYEAELFAVESGVPVLVVEGVAFTADDEPVEWFRAVYRADRITLSIDSRRVGTGQAGGVAELGIVLAQRI